MRMQVLSPARVQPLYGAGRKESSVTGLQGMRDRSMQSGTELAREIQQTDWSTVANLSNRSSGVQIPLVIIHQTHYEKSDWSRAFNQFTIACELDMINAISASAWLLSPLECSPPKQNG